MRALVAAIMYIAVAASANLIMLAVSDATLTQFLIVDVTTCFFLIAFDLVTRDYLHEYFAGRGVLFPLFAIILAGGFVSFVLNAQVLRIAIASSAAFLAAGIADTLVYALARRFPRVWRINVSNVAAACVDSIVWPTIALSSVVLPVTAAELVAKLVGGMFWSIVLLQLLWSRRHVRTVR